MSDKSRNREMLLWLHGVLYGSFMFAFIMAVIGGRT